MWLFPFPCFDCVHRRKLLHLIQMQLYCIERTLWYHQPQMCVQGFAVLLNYSQFQHPVPNLSVPLKRHQEKMEGELGGLCQDSTTPSQLVESCLYPSERGDCSVACPELHRGGAGKSLETSKSRIISILPQRHGALSKERAKNVLSHSVMSESWTVAHQAPLSMGILQAEILEGVCHALLWGIFPTQGSNPGLPHCMQMLYLLSH